MMMMVMMMITTMMKVMVTMMMIIMKMVMMKMILIENVVNSGKISLKTVLPINFIILSIFVISQILFPFCSIE